MQIMHKGKVDVVVDLQFGSTGKGLLCGHLAATGKYDTVINANLPNAGHTTVTKDGRKWMHKAMPNGVEATKRIMMGPGSAFDPRRLVEELAGVADLLVGKDFCIHEAAVVVTAEHKAVEQATLSRVSSTMQGSGEAVCAKIRRQGNTIVRDNMELMEELGLDQYVVTHQEYLQHIMDADKILIEGAQGYSLGHNSGFYPYCTSRDCTATRFLADCCIPAGWLGTVYGVARLHPIRVGNTADGYSGDIYPDQEETSWEALGVEPELTTVTKRVRRVFTFSMQQMQEAVIANGCDQVLLNFANYDPDQAVEVINEVNGCMARGMGMDKLITMVGLGPQNDQIHSVETFINAMDDTVDGVGD